MAEFKGVMLCDRPPEPAPRHMADVELRPFFAGAKGYEQLGLQPCQKLFPKSIKPPVDTVFTKHLRWLREAQAQERGRRAAELESEQQAEARKRRLAERTAAYCRSVLDGSCREDSFLTADMSNYSQSAPQPAEQAEEASAGRPASYHSAHPAAEAAYSRPVSAYARVEEPPASAPAAQPSRPASRAGTTSAAAKRAPKLPAWALTAEAAEEEEEEEAEDLLRFADGLDFQSYIDETCTEDLTQALSTLVRIEKKAQDAAQPRRVETVGDEPEWANSFVSLLNTVNGVRQGADDSGVGDRPAAGYELPPRPGTACSNAASVARSRASVRRSAVVRDSTSWDTSTSVLPKTTRTGDEAIAEDLLQEFPELRGIHSIKSLKTVVEKAAAKEEAG